MLKNGLLHVDLVREIPEAHEAAHDRDRQGGKRAKQIEASRPRKLRAHVK